MKTLYRVHSALNREKGMYRSSDVANEYMSGEARHPAPYQDGPFWTAWDKHGEDKNKFFFGFATLDKFTSWIYDARWWHKLHEEGCVMSLWILPDNKFIEGYTQAAGLISGINPVMTVTVPEWHKLKGYADDLASTTVVHPVLDAPHHDCFVQSTRLSDGDLYVPKAGCGIAR